MTGRPPGHRPPVLLAVAHGTRDPAGVRTLHRLLDRVRALRPALRVECAFLGLAEPRPQDVLSGLTGAAVLVPVLLGPGYHVSADIPAVLAAAGRPGGRAARPLGPDPLLASAHRKCS
ncbi:CbiX/SirB N-terminal domain-containing protein, partial [Streptomyces sp. NPDC049577]|uniref:sirohydrochlorin chelatase n=1 Tax=Streptomyces sp. NPDC049577 TaxID=3155153 RepID=UPI00341A1746